MIHSLGCAANHSSTSLKPRKFERGDQNRTKSSSTSRYRSHRRTQEVLNFCAEHDTARDIRFLDLRNINDAYKHVEHSEVRFRDVIHTGTLKRQAA